MVNKAETIDPTTLARLVEAGAVRDADVTGHPGASLKTTRVRPDSAERMRSAFEVKAHADWMQQKVAQSLADAAPNVSHAQVMADAQAVIDAKRKSMAAKPLLE